MQEDPYFRLLKDYSSGSFMKRGALSQYWESMQRQYGELKNVPSRDDPSFAKALEHRTREKQFYDGLHRENESMRHQMQLGTQELQGLRAENNRLYDLISRFQAIQQTPRYDEPPAGSGSNSSRSVAFAAETVQAESDGRDRRADEPAGRGGEDHPPAAEGDGAVESEG